MNGLGGRIGASRITGRSLAQVIAQEGMTDPKHNSLLLEMGMHALRKQFRLNARLRAEYSDGRPRGEMLRGPSV